MYLMYKTIIIKASIIRQTKRSLKHVVLFQIFTSSERLSLLICDTSAVIGELDRRKAEIPESSNIGHFGAKHSQRHGTKQKGNTSLPFN